MKSTLWLVSLIGSAILLAACGGEAYDYPVPSGPLNTPAGGGSGGYPAAHWTQTADALVTAGNHQQSPTAEDSFNGYVPLSQLGVSSIDCGFEFTTPANTPFSFSVLSLAEGNSGGALVRVAHALPSLGSSTGAESIMEEGMAVEGPGLTYIGDWWQIGGDGLARMEVHGSIARSQVLVFEVANAQRTQELAVRLKIGQHSDINSSVGGPGSGASISRKTIYSSDELTNFLPAIAVSGDRYSVACYDNDPSSGRMRRWLQYNATAGSVTGGESTSTAADSGTWRDQEIAAYNNVLAVAYTGNNEVRTQISLDRGASFPIDQVLSEYTTGISGQRLVQIELAQDYTLAIAYWRTGASQDCELCVTEASPTGFDANNTPTGYSFGAPWVVHSAGGWVVPIVMDLEYSSAGDLVVGYGYNEDLGWQRNSYFRCAVRDAAGNVNDQLIDTDIQTWGNDPSVSLIGSGSSMQIFYAYEMSDGVHLQELRNGGAALGNAITIATRGAYLPSVHARMQGGKLRVDLLYLAPENLGWSLRRVNWADFTNAFTSPVHSSIVASSSHAGGTSPSPTVPGKIIETVAWMGYDAVTDGDNVAIALHTCHWDVYGQYNGALPGPATPPSFFGSGTGGTTLLPGMTGTVPAPNANDANQLEVIVID